MTTVDSVKKVVSPEKVGIAIEDVFALARLVALQERGPAVSKATIEKQMRREQLERMQAIGGAQLSQFLANQGVSGAATAAGHHGVSAAMIRAAAGGR